MKDHRAESKNEEDWKCTIEFRKVSEELKDYRRKIKNGRKKERKINKEQSNTDAQKEKQKNECCGFTYLGNFLRSWRKLIKPF